MRKAIARFFAGLFMMAMVALGIGRISANWGAFHWGRLNGAIGFILAAAGLGLVIWSVRAEFKLGKGTPFPQVATRTLVTSGPYAYTRNPMTLGALGMYLGIGVGLGSSVVIILTGLVFSGLLTFIYYHETSELAQRFGEAYRAYRKQTPFFLPRLHRRR